MHYRPPFSHRASARQVAHRAFGFGALPYGSFGALPSTPLEAFKQLKADIESTKAEIAALNGQLKTAKSNLPKAQGALLRCESSSLAGFRGFGQLSGAWEDWCSAGGAASKYGGRMAVCMDNSIPCNFNAPWTAAGMACRFSKYGANPLNVVKEVVSFVAPSQPAPVEVSSPAPDTPAAPVCTAQAAAVSALESQIATELPAKIAAANEKLRVLTARVPEAQAEAQKQLDMEAAREAALEEAKREQAKILKQEQRKGTLQKTGNTALKVGGVAAAAFVLKMLLF